MVPHGIGKVLAPNLNITKEIDEQAHCYMIAQIWSTEVCKKFKEAFVSAEYLQ